MSRISKAFRSIEFFNNCVNMDDIFLFVEKIRSGQMKSIASLIAGSGKDRAESAWESTEEPPTSWYNIPAVQKRCNRLITSNKNTAYFQYITTKYLSNKAPVQHYHLDAVRESENVDGQNRLQSNTWTHTIFHHRE